MDEQTDTLVVTFRVDDVEGGWALFEILVSYKIKPSLIVDGSMIVETTGAEIKKLRDQSSGIYAHVCECF